MFGVDAGTLEQKGSCWNYFWSIWRLCMRRSGASRRSNVATSPRRDVPTSQRWVNQYNSQQAATLRRHDVEMSRRQREICPPSLKAAKGSEFGGIGRRTKEGTEFQSRSDTHFEEVPVICIVSHFLDIRMMFLRLNIFICLFSIF